MNELYLGDPIQKNSQPMVDFNYAKSSRRNPRKSMFQILSPKMNPKNVVNNNPKEIFKASNNINSILSKNLKSIYHENKDEIFKDNNPLFENVSCLIQKNNDTNKYIYNQIMNFNNNNNNNDPQFKGNDVIRPKKKSKKDKIFKTLIKKNIDLLKELENLEMNEQKESFNVHKYEIKTPKNIGRISLFGNKKRSSKKLDTNNNNNNKNIINFTSEALLGQNNANNNTKENKFSKNKPTPNKRHKSSPINNLVKKNKSKFLNDNDKNNKTNKLNKISNFKKRQLSVGFFENKFKIDSKINSKTNSKINSKINSKAKESSIHSVLVDDNMKIPTLNQINSAITKTFIGDKFKQIRKELADLEKNEISEMIKKLPKKKFEEKKNNKLSTMIMSEIIEANKTAQNDTSKALLNSKNDENNNIEDDRIQKKYRKLYLSKNLYDSLDDEEILEEEKVFFFYIAPNSFKAYFIDCIILISALIELFYLPIYISMHISSFSIYHNIISTILLCVLDVIYMFDLVTGFFRAYYNFEEVLIKKNVKICVHYLTGWFIFDLIQSIPFFTLLDKNMNTTRMHLLPSNKGESNIFDFGLNNKYFSLTFLKLIKILLKIIYKINRLLKLI